MIHDHLIQILHEPAVIITVKEPARHPVQRRRRVDGFRQRPVHPVMNHRLAVPIRRIGNAAGSVRIPGIQHRTVEQVLRRVQCDRIRSAPYRHRPLRDESGPFDAVSRCCAIGLEGIVRPVRIARKVRLPGAGVVLRNPPVIALCPCDDMRDDPSGSLPIALLSGRIRHRQKGLHGMHIGIDPAVRIQLLEIHVPGVDGESLVVFPEIPVIHGLRMLQQLLCSRPPGQHRAAGCQNDKGVRIALLRSVGDTVCMHARVPAVMLPVLQLTGQAL